MKRLVQLAALAALTTSLSACEASFSVGGFSVKKADVETQTAQQISNDETQTQPVVTCPGDLKAKVGTTMTCTTKAEGVSGTYNVSLNVTSVDNKTKRANWHIEVSQTPNA